MNHNLQNGYRISIYASFCFVLLVVNSVIPISLIATSFGQQFEPSLIQMPLGLTSELDYSEKGDNSPLRDKVFEGALELTDDNGGQGKMEQANIVYESQDIDSQSGNINNLAQADSEKNNAKELTYDNDEKQNSHDNDEKQNSQNSQKNIKGPVKLTFVDSYWTNNIAPETVVASISSGQVTAQQMPPVARQEVDPAEGNSVLAVTIINQGFSDISGVKGYFDFPSGFKALVTPDNVDSDTAISTYNGVVKAGQSFVLYFPVSILQNTQVGKEYQGQMKIKYFKLTEQSKKDFRTANIEIPFRLSGKVILEVKGSNQNPIAPNSNEQNPVYPFARSDIINAAAGTPNTLKIELSNLGSASATGVVVNVLNNNQQITNGNQVVGVSNSTTSNDITTTQVPYINLGDTVFNIGTISPNQKFDIDPVIFPPASSGNVIQNLDIRILYNDAYGNKKSINHLVGIQVVPTSPQNDIFVSPASFEKDTQIQNSPQFISDQSDYNRNLFSFNYMGISDVFPFRAHPVTTLLSPETPGVIEKPKIQDAEKQIEIVAGKLENISFSLNSFGKSEQTGAGTLSDIAVTLTPQSPSVKILGKSVWNIPNVGNVPNVLTTKVFASPSLIGNPVFFTVNVQYLKNYQELKTANFNLGAIVTGNIELDVNDVALRPIGNSYSIVGNILNQGNDLAQFSKISIMEQQIPDTKKDSNSSVASPLVPKGNEISEYIGDLPVNEPIPFNLPVSNSQMQYILNSEENPTLQPNDPLNNSIILPMKLTYTDSIQKIHEIVMYKPLQINPNSLYNNQGSTSNNNGFINSYWASDAPLQSNSASTSNTFTKLSIQRAVGPGEGSSILAVELSNTGFSDITGVTGYLKLPPGFVADNSGTGILKNDQLETNSFISVASTSDLIKSGQTYTLYFKVKVLSSATLGNHLGSLSLYYFKVPDAKIGTYRIQDIDIPFYIP
ncbi:MAG: hypothetical protein M3Q77_09015, partial [Thermoproteota archaeon]|nr:hypothetical protein [Thermoproteota archaeon]